MAYQLPILTQKEIVTMYGQFLNILIILVFGFYSVASFANYPLTIEHAGKKPVVIKQKPKKVVVFDLGVLDTLTALDVEVTAVAKGVFPDYLAGYNTSDKAIAGSLFKPDYAKLKDIKPDLIIVGGRSRKALDKLSGIAPTIDLTVNADTFVPSVKRNVLLLGSIFDKKQQAKSLWEKLNSKILTLQAKAKSKGAGLVLFTVKDVFIAHLPGDRFGMVYDLLGIPSVDKINKQTDSKANKKQTKAQKAKHAATLTKAYIEKKPDWLFILDRGLATAGQSNIKQALTSSPFIKNSNAWQKNHVYYLNPTQWYVVTGGYTSVLNTVNDLNTLW